MPFCGNVSVPRIIKLVEKAVKDGSARHENRFVEVSGNVKRYTTFTGPFLQLDGKISFHYYRSKILTVDFVNHRITDHGMSSFSSCTRITLDGYVDAVLALVKVKGLGRAKWRFMRWTATPSPGSAYARFIAQAPWVEVDRTDTVWFCWDRYDEALVDVYDNSQRDLRKDQQWRWFEYAWDENGAWTRKFIDASAERRYRQHEEKCRRTSTTTRSTSSRPSRPAAPLPPLMLPWTNTTPSAFLPGTGAPLSTLG